MTCKKLPVHLRPGTEQQTYSPCCSLNSTSNLLLTKVPHTGLLSYTEFLLPTGKSNRLSIAYFTMWKGNHIWKYVMMSDENDFSHKVDMLSRTEYVMMSIANDFSHNAWRLNVQDGAGHTHSIFILSTMSRLSIIVYINFIYSKLFINNINWVLKFLFYFIFSEIWIRLGFHCRRKCIYLIIDEEREERQTLDTFNIGTCNELHAVFCIG